VAERRAIADKASTEQVQKRGSENDLLVENVFRNSHAISVNLSPTDRVELLVRLASTAGKKHPEKARQWALEALRLANEMHPTVQRAQFEVHAIGSLAVVDSEKALALLPSLEAPASPTDDDTRAKAASSVFQEFLSQHPDDWQKLSSVAQRIGDTGNYPFQAIQIVISSIGSKDPESAATLIQQAIRYYNLSAHSPSSNHQFATLLAEDSRFVSGSTLKTTLETVLSSLLNADRAPSQDITKAGAAGYEDASALNRATFALLVPLINSVDPELEQKLRQERPSLTPAVSVVGHLEGQPIIVGPATLPSTESVITMIFPDAKAQLPTMVADLAKCSDGSDPIQTLQTPSPEDVARFLDDSEETFKKAGDPEQKLRILVERGVSLASSERRAELSNILADAFALGEKLFRKSVDEDPQASWNGRPGARGLSTLVEAAAKTAPQIVLERIRNMHTSVLQGQLYASFVEGVQSEQDSASVMVMRAGK